MPLIEVHSSTTLADVANIADARVLLDDVLRNVQAPTSSAFFVGTEGCQGFSFALGPDAFSLRWFAHVEDRIRARGSTHLWLFGSLR